ncbi:MAG TPA: hypothetical protein VI653_22265 [Steroidobacteraceae bacterium]
MRDPAENRALAALILRTIAGALIVYGVVQLVIGVVGPATGVAAAAPFRTQGVLHGLAGVIVWVLAAPLARIIARGALE